MFKAVRDAFLDWRVGALSALRSPPVHRLAGLFMFEFIVVVAGVLVAQLLQEWVSDARARDEAEQAIERSRADALRSVLIADHWLKVGPCLERRIARVARVAAIGGTLEARNVGRPGLPLPSSSTWAESTTLVARRLYGQDLIDQHASVALNASISRREQEAIARRWALFDLLDPSLGPPSAADRANVRVAATEVRASINLLTTNAKFIKAQAEKMGIRPAKTDRLEVSNVDFNRVVNACGLLRQWPTR